MAARSSGSPVSPLEAHLGFWLRFVSNHVSARFQRQLEQRDISISEWVALRTLWAQPETRHAGLVRALGMTKGATSKVMSRLEHKGLAQRASTGKGTGGQALVLTAAGRALVPRLAKVADANDAHFFGHLSAKQRQSLMDAMQALVKHHRLQQVPTT